MARQEEEEELVSVGESVVLPGEGIEGTASQLLMKVAALGSFKVCSKYF
jgi:hypothetical protein